MQVRLVVTSAIALGLGLASATASGNSMSKEEIQSVVLIETVAIPSPGEFFAAMDKLGKPTWSQFYSGRTSSNPDSRAQMALILGTLVADGYLAVEAQDEQGVKNTGKEIISLAKKLNVSQSILGRGQSINDFAGNNDWNALKEELEATQNEVKLAMAEQKDQSLVSLVSLGAWIRATEVACNYVVKNYSPESAKVLRQPAIIGYFLEKLDGLPEPLRNEPLIGNIRKGLTESKRLVDTKPGEPPSEEVIASLRKTTATMVKEISQGVKE